MKFANLFFVTIFILSLTSASCESNQIDINSASLEELDTLYGIGPAKAQSIIDSRPYDSVDDLVNAYGIGPATLEKIKQQGLVCIEDENGGENNFEEVDSEEKYEVFEEKMNEKERLLDEEGEEKIEEVQSVIRLNGGKDIKSEKNLAVLENKNLTSYGLVGFVILLGILFFIRKKSIYKNEFES